VRQIGRENWEPVYYNLNVRSKPRSRRVAARRVAILRSAAAAFRRRGFHGASVEAIARAVRMTKGNLYYYFADKEAILYACHDYSLGLALALMAAVRRSRQPPDRQLRRLIEGFVHLITDELHGSALTLELDALGPARRRRIVARRDRFDRGLRAILRRGIRQGVFVPGDAKLYGFAIMGAMNWIARWYDPAGPVSSNEIARTFADYLVRGLSVRPRATAPRTP
jgi:AcrR family transcriptional regulator